MILVGSGALVWRAATYAASVGRTVEAVVHPYGEAVPAGTAALDCIATDDVNELAEFIDDVSGDRLICSTGNPFLFREPILELDLTVVNIHGGPLPGYRGLPLATAVFAILRGEQEFGVTLHRVDAGIDTGPVVDRRAFPLSESVTLEELSMQVTHACHELFKDNIDTLDRAPMPSETIGPDSTGQYFGMRSLAAIGAYRDHPNFVRATTLGVLAEFYPSYSELFGSVRHGPVG